MYGIEVMTRSALALALTAGCGGRATLAPASHPTPAEEPTPVERGQSLEATGSAAVQLDSQLRTAESNAWLQAKPVFDKYCAGCHTQTGKQADQKKLDDFDFTIYPSSTRHPRTIGFTVRDVLGISETKPTMPADQPGTVSGRELATAKIWIDAWEAAERGGAHRPARSDTEHDDD